MAVVGSLAVTATLAAVVIHTTQGPFGGFFGLWGPDVFVGQSVGARFIPSDNYTLDRVKIWFMNNSATVHGTVKVTVRDDQSIAGNSIPGNTILAQWTVNIQALGWNPVQEVFDSAGGVGLVSGVKYWVVAESTSAASVNPVWNYASVGNTFSALTSPGGSTGLTWQPGANGAALTLTVEGTLGLPNPADINRDGRVDGADLAAVLSAWGSCTNCDADVNHDQIVDGLDLTAVLSAWSP